MNEDLYTELLDLYTYYTEILYINAVRSFINSLLFLADFCLRFRFNSTISKFLKFYFDFYN